MGGLAAPHTAACRRLGATDLLDAFGLVRGGHLLSFLHLQFRGVVFLWFDLAELPSVDMSATKGTPYNLPGGVARRVTSSPPAQNFASSWQPALG